MSSGWPLVKLGDVLTQARREEAVDRAKVYRLLGVRWYGEGLFAKESKGGHEIGAGRLSRVCAGDFVYNRLFAWKGSFALAGDEFDGFHVSNEFPCFAVDTSRADPRFLLWYFRQAETWAMALGVSVGATPTSRNRLKETVFLGFEIRLPPLAEQERIVACIEEVAGKVEEVRRLRQQAAKEGETLLRAIIWADKTAVRTPMRELVRLRPPDVIVRAEESYQFAGVYSFGRGVFKAHLRSGTDFAYPKLTRLRAGDFVYPKLMAWEGALGVVPAGCDGCVVSTEFPVFEIEQTRVYPEVLDTHFRTPSVWPEISGASTGTNVRRRRLNPKDFLAYSMPVPSMRTQERLRAVHAKMHDLKRPQSDAAAELDALLPAVLDRAFKGEL